MAARPSREYWLERSIQREHEAYLRGVELNKRLFEEYDRSARELRKTVRAFYARYGSKHDLTYEEAVKKLSAREMKEWKATLEEYLEEINTVSDPKVRTSLIAQLDALSTNSQISRLDALTAEVRAQMDQLYDSCRADMAAGFSKIYEQSYYKKHYDLQIRAGRFADVVKLTPDMISDAVSYPWSGAMFSDRLWRNKETLLFNIREIIAQGLIQGKSLPETSKQLSSKMGQSYKAAERLVRTETNHLHNRADLAAYAAAGIAEYEFMATLDARTCAECGALDGKHFPIKDAQPGVNFPPIHPNDRCTTVEYDPDDAADWAASGEKMPDGMTYGEWSVQQGIAAKAPRNTGKKVKYNPDADFSIRIDGYSQNVLDGLSTASIEVVREGAKDGFEHLCLVDLTSGAILYREVGDEASVGGVDFWEFIRGNSKGRFAFVHNHPTDGYFSEADMRTLLSDNPVDVFIAVRHDGIRYVAEKLKTPPETFYFDALYQDEINALNQQYRDGIIDIGDRMKLREELLVDNLLRDYTKGLIELGG